MLVMSLQSCMCCCCLYYCCNRWLSPWRSACMHLLTASSLLLRPQRWSIFLHRRALGNGRMKRRRMAWSVATMETWLYLQWILCLQVKTYNIRNGYNFTTRTNNLGNYRLRKTVTLVQPLSSFSSQLYFHDTVNPKNLCVFFSMTLVPSPSVSLILELAMLFITCIGILPIP